MPPWGHEEQYEQAVWAQSSFLKKLTSLCVKDWDWTNCWAQEEQNEWVKKWGCWCIFCNSLTILTLEI